MEVFLYANGVVSLVTGTALTAVILSRRVQEGVVIKAGLMVVVLSLFASGAVSLFSDSPGRGLVNSAFALRLGLLVVCIGVFMRARGATPRRRLSDFVRPNGQGR